LSVHALFLLLLAFLLFTSLLLGDIHLRCEKRNTR
jgi:hypothetical protein